MDSLMSDRIQRNFERLETENNITIVFAVDSGSRARGFNNNDSDNDIRFVYVQNDFFQYVTCLKKPDTVCGFSDDKKLDWQGWDIKKALTHLKESNPSVIEWLYSPLMYIDKYDFKKNCLDIVRDMHTHMSLVYHYYNMAKTNWNDWITGKKSDIICKKYFYVIRPVATLQYISSKHI